VLGPPSTAGTSAAATRVSLTARDLQTLRLLAAGRSTAAIAAAMSISSNTARTRIHRLQAKLGAPARDQVAPRAAALGLAYGPAGPPGVIPEQRRAASGAVRTHGAPVRPA
jgi:DNA-binding CsgD family transcriptional regulator